MAQTDQVDEDRTIITNAMGKGPIAMLGAFVRLSGPGWLQSAITLGGGSLAGALFLGILGGTSMLWLQLVAIIMGVVMLSAISYVTLSTGERPFRLINRHINPVLGWSWLIATVLANMIWCMPQFSLCYAALEKNLLSDEQLANIPGAYVLGSMVSPSKDPSKEESVKAAAADGKTGEAGTAVDVKSPEKMPADKSGSDVSASDVSASADKEIAQLGAKIIISILLLITAGGAVFFNSQQGRAAKMFDWFLKGLVGIIVVCFVGVVGLLAAKGKIDWDAIGRGFTPDLSQARKPTGKIAELIATLAQEQQDFWNARIVAAQAEIMIGAAATAVGVNMTFLMPYSMLRRGWDRNFRGLARFDLSTGMAIPYILVTSCVVIAAATQFHAQADDQFLSNDPAVMRTSPLFEGAAGQALAARLGIEGNTSDLSDEDVASIAALANEEKLVAASLQKRKAEDLAKALEPLLGKEKAQLAFGLGIFGMGFSTIIILMLINGFAICEVANKALGGTTQFIGCLIAGLSGAAWWYVWTGESQVYLAIVASKFGFMLLPIAYVTFFIMMNSRKILQDDKPTGVAAVVWNVLMGASVIGATCAAGYALLSAITDPKAGTVVITIGICFLVAVICGFIHKSQSEQDVPA